MKTKPSMDFETAKQEVLDIIRKYPLGISTPSLVEESGREKRPLVAICQLLRQDRLVEELGAVKGKSGGSIPAHGWKPIRHFGKAGN